MLIDFREISEAGLNVVSDEAIVWLDNRSSDPLRELYSFPRAFHVSARLEKASGNVSLRGRFEGEAVVQCVRCLKAFERSLDADFNLTLLPRSEEGTAGEEEKALESDDLDVRFYDEEQIDLGEVLSEQIILSLDLYPHCRPECKGLCPECGKDRNEVECACSDEKKNSRWAALKQIKLAKNQ